MQEWRFCTDFPDAFKYPHNGGNFHNFSQLIRRVVVPRDVFVQQHGGLLFKQTVKSYCRGVWVICAKPLLLTFLDQIHTRQFLNVIFNQQMSPSLPIYKNIYFIHSFIFSTEKNAILSTKESDHRYIQ